MFENYAELPVEEREVVKIAHRRLRTRNRERGDRYDNLTWGFVRGFPYRRIERKTRSQTLPDGSCQIHNRPDPAAITRRIAEVVPDFAPFDPTKPWLTKADPRVVEWLSEPFAIAKAAE